MITREAEFSLLRRRCAAVIQNLRAALQEAESELQDLAVSNDRSRERAFMEQRNKETKAWNDYVIAFHQLGFFLHRQQSKPGSEAE